MPRRSVKAINLEEYQGDAQRMARRVIGTNDGFGSHISGLVQHHNFRLIRSGLHQTYTRAVPVISRLDHAREGTTTSAAVRDLVNALRV